MRIQRTSLRFRIYKEARRKLADVYPQVFPRHGRRPPLKVGVRKDLITVQAAGLSATKLRTFLQIWTTSSSYLASVAAGGARMDLTGRPIEPVEPSHSAEATATLATRRTRSRGGDAAIRRRKNS